MSINISQLTDHSISVDQARYATSLVEQYLDTVTIKENPNFHKATSTRNMVFTNKYALTSDEQMELLYIENNIYYCACVGSLILFFSSRVYLCFAVHNLAKCSSDTGKVHFEGLVHLLKCSRD